MKFPLYILDNYNIEKKINYYFIKIFIHKDLKK